MHSTGDVLDTGRRLGFLEKLSGPMQMELLLLATRKSALERDGYFWFPSYKRLPWYIHEPKLDYFRKDLQSMRNAIEVRTEGALAGRGIFARKAFNKGELVLKDNPVIAVHNFVGCLCYHCGKEVKKPRR